MGQRVFFINCKEQHRICTFQSYSDVRFEDLVTTTIRLQGSTVISDVSSSAVSEEHSVSMFRVEIYLLAYFLNRVIFCPEDGGNNMK
jgi:hypothetical protein